MYTVCALCLNKQGATYCPKHSICGYCTPWNHDTLTSKRLLSPRVSRLERFPGLGCRCYACLFTCATLTSPVAPSVIKLGVCDHLTECAISMCTFYWHSGLHISAFCRFCSSIECMEDASMYNVMPRVHVYTCTIMLSSGGWICWSMAVIIFMGCLQTTTVPWFWEYISQTPLRICVQGICF